MEFQSPVRDTRICLSFAQNKRLRHEIYIDAGDKTRNEEIFEHLERQRQLFETEYGRPLEWEALPNARACRIAEYREDADVTFEDRYDESSTGSSMRVRGCAAPCPPWNRRLHEHRSRVGPS